MVNRPAYPLSSTQTMLCFQRNPRKKAQGGASSSRPTWDSLACQVRQHVAWVESGELDWAPTPEELKHPLLAHLCQRSLQWST
jgi:hypothetical protein